MRSMALAAVLGMGVLVIACDKREEDRPPPRPAPAATQAPAPQPSVAPQATPSAIASQAPAAPPSASAVAVAVPPEATKVFNERCALCHGAHGKGDGAGGQGMKPPPRNWTDPAWQASVTDDHIAKALLKGGQAIGESPTMPPSPDLEGKPAIVDGLVKVVRSFRAPG